MKRKLVISFVVILSLFLFQADFYVVKMFDKPDISCVVDEDCTISSNVYEGCVKELQGMIYYCPLLAHNKKWKYYEPIIGRVFTSIPAEREMALPTCINSTCVKCPLLSNPQTERCALVFSKFIKAAYQNTNISKISGDIREIRGICENITDLSMKAECEDNFRILLEQKVI